MIISRIAIAVVLGLITYFLLMFLFPQLQQVLDVLIGLAVALITYFYGVRL